MEIGQILHGDPVCITTPDYVDSLMAGIRNEISRVYWNVNQRSFYDPGPGDIGFRHEPWGEKRESAPPLGIPGIEWWPYYNWGGSPDDADRDHAAARPNFSFEGVEIRWYKHFGRSMNANVQWHPEKWVRWYERVFQTLRAWESRNSPAGYIERPYPDPAGAVNLTEDAREYYHTELQERVALLEAQLNSIACVCLGVANGEEPQADKEDWRYCNELEWVARLGRHALTAPTKFQLHGSAEK